VGGLKFYRDNLSWDNSPQTKGLLTDLLGAIQTAVRETTLIKDAVDKAGDPLPKSIQFVNLVLLTSASMECYRLMGM